MKNSNNLNFEDQFIQCFNYKIIIGISCCYEYVVFNSCKEWINLKMSKAQIIEGQIEGLPLKSN